MTAPLSLSSAFPFSERPRRLSAPAEDRLRRWLARIPDLPQPFLRWRFQRIVTLAAKLEPWAHIAMKTDPVAAAREAGNALRLDPRSKRAMARLLALIRAACKETLGLRPYDVQLLGATALLQGRLVEMETGEGKTLAAAVAAACAALSGRSTHVVTVNDYLAQRDSEIMTPLYDVLGISTGLVLHDMKPDERRRAYTAEIVYVTNKEVTFDYLRDHLRRKQWSNEAFRRIHRLAHRENAIGTVLQGLRLAIVDEADSILIDEAKTPLIISGAGTESGVSDVVEPALAIARALIEGQHYGLDRINRSVDLTQQGFDRVSMETKMLGSAWRDALARVDLIQKALSALHLFERDVHYLVADGAVQIIDEYTGRLMPDRFWSDGLHQMVESKEGLATSASHGIMTRITYQRFFTRYGHLCGMSGTLKECGSELRETYRLKTVRIPTHRVTRRRFVRTQIFATAAEKWTAIADLARDLVAEGRPVLIGTRTVATSRLASRHLEDAGVDHVVLSAAQDADEADIISQAGTSRRVTVATNLAGRGTDIKLADGLFDRGGLAVVLSERHEAARIDRQLAGRCGRQGEPGTVHVMLSLDDSILDFHRGSRIGRAMIGAARRRRWLAVWLIRSGQRRSERVHHIVRRDLLRLEERLIQSMAFSGPPE